jgi:hypothetical protein
MLKSVNEIAEDPVSRSYANNTEIQTNTGHYYMECSNKGICDRDAGECSCFPGYEGSACQRASCPGGKEGVCSGHGTCKSIKELAEDDNNNHYMLWDADVTLGCDCDAGWSGADCSSRECKYGYDPLFYDNENTIRYSNYTFVIYSQKDGLSYEGKYSLKFYDAYGEDWETGPIDIRYHSEALPPYESSRSIEAQTCDAIRDAMESIPNDVIPKGTVKCRAYTDFKNQIYEKYMPTTHHLQNFWPLVGFVLAFPENPGALKQPEFNFHLDGSRPSAYTTTTSDDLQSWVYPNGFQGEEVDIVPDYCEGVVVTLDESNSLWTLAFEDEAVMLPLFKKCLGEADSSTATTAADIYDWDYGTPRNPHLIKLVDRSYKQSNGEYTPATEFCNTTSEELAGVEIDGASLGKGWCLNSNPPGFYMVTYFYFDSDPSALDGSVLPAPPGKFVVFQSTGEDYKSRTSGGTVYFDVFTTTGTMTSVSSYVQAYNYDLIGRPHAVNTTMSHTNEMYTYSDALDDVDPSADPRRHDVSCEWSLNAAGTLNRVYKANVPAKQETQRACLNKGDTVFFLNIGIPNSKFAGEGNSKSVSNLADDVNVAKWQSYSSSNTRFGGASAYNFNPKYLNYYTVEKVGREEPTWHNPTTERNATSVLQEMNRIVLDQSVNYQYFLDREEATDPTQLQATAKIYKFTMPDSDKLKAKYATTCSSRGICNGEEGLCECFAGYTGDACQTQNALAQ